MNETKFTNKVTKIGTSRWILVPSHITKELGINDGDKVVVTLEKAIDEVNVKCPSCNNLFSAKKEDVYDCPYCDKDGILASEGELIE